MELSMREAKARFTEAAAAAARGERVIVTKHGHPFVELVPARKGKFDWDKLDRVRKKLGLDQVEAPELPDYFDDPAFSRRVLGLEE